MISRDGVWASPDTGYLPLEVISVIIVNWNGRGYLAECLNSLRKQSFRRFSTILVDNGSTDGSVAFVRRNYPEVRLEALSRNTGFSAANNFAIRTVRSPYIALLNNDAVAHPQWLKTLVEALDARPEAGFAASRILFYQDRTIVDRAGDSYSTAGSGLLRGRGSPADAFDSKEWVFGACAAAALYRRSLFHDIGLFDEDFFLLYEDVDLSFRAQLRNYQCLYVPDAVVYHRASGSIVHDSPVSVYYSHRNLEWVYVQNMPGRLIARTILLHVVYNLAAGFYFSANGRMVDFIRAKWDACKGMRKALQKRRQIQKNRTASDFYIWRLLEKEQFFPRLAIRFGKRPR